jgi:pyrimidine operon attenuation protein/uracil phosphoribosyltransferase
MAAAKPQTVLDARAFDRTLRRMADEIVELNNGTEGLVIVGIQRRGVQLAARIVSEIEARESAQVPQGALDITLYRDDLQTVGPRPVVGQTRIPVDIDGKHVVIVDDVLYTGRTIRAALDALFDKGRPARVQLLALIDRGHRELPIEARYVGRMVQTSSNEIIEVKFQEIDNMEKVLLVEKV